MEKSFAEQPFSKRGSERRPEVITDPEKFRQIMRQFWQRDIDLENLKGGLASRDGSEKPPASRDSFLLASQNVEQGKVIEALILCQKIYIRESL